jgi:putative ABC transport system substrate-binding protein
MQGNPKGHRIRRRDFVVMLGGAAVMIMPAVALPQTSGKIPVIGGLAPIPADDPVFRRNFGMTIDALAKLGWEQGRNVRIELRGTPGPQPDMLRERAADLVGLMPDVILAVTAPAAVAAHQTTHTVPIVFVLVDDPIGLGLVDSITRPGGNVTGFMQYEAAIGGKWLQLLRGLAPSLTRVLFVYNPKTAQLLAPYRQSLEAAAPTFGVTVTAAPVREESDIKEVITEFAREPNGGLIIPQEPFLVANRVQIIELAIANRLPAVYPLRFFATDGGLLSYGIDQKAQSVQIVSYLDRILRGTRPAELPVQGPTKYELVINAKTAKAMSLTIEPTLLALADEMIE